MVDEVDDEMALVGMRLSFQKTLERNNFVVLSWEGAAGW